MKTAIEWLLNEQSEIHEDSAIAQQALLREKDQLGALYLTLLLNTPDITKFDFEQWYKQNMNK
jgi:hypothetical protein